MSTYQDLIQTAFPDQQLCSRILAEAAHEPTRLPQLFEDISRYVLSLRGQSTDGIPNHSKKRKLEDARSTQANGAASAGITIPVVSFECKDVSFQAPARKKLKLQLVEDVHDKRKGEVRLLNPTSDDLEYALSGEQIDQAFCLPVPEKQARQMNILIFPKSGATFADGMPAEPLLFTLNETAPAGVSGTLAASLQGDTYVKVTNSALARFLFPYGNVVVLPCADEFASSIPQSHRKGEKAYHVNAHRGSKEGYLFFLENGIVFGFKKPLAFFPFSAIESISYTSVLQRTFNLAIGAMEGELGAVKEIEFSMLDQADFAGIDEYVKRHGLNDASMAAQRRAKAYNVNKDKKSVETNGGAEGGGVEDGGELQKAEQELQDDEDELEEDYVESEGEDDDSEEDGEEYEEEGYEEGEEEEDDVEGGVDD